MIPIKSDKIKLTYEYQLLDRLKKLYKLYSCPDCKYGYNCCWKCKESDGYLRYKVESENYPDEFWDKDNGCRLPYHLRSVTCITHLCDERKAEMDKDYLVGLDALREMMRKLEFDLYLMEIK